MKLLTFILIGVLLISYSQAQVDCSLKIIRERPVAAKLSEITESAESIVLKIPSENELFSIIDVLFGEDKIFIIDSNNPDHALPKRLSLFKSDGSFLKHVGPARRIAIDELNDHIYLQYYTNTIAVYTLNGDSIRSFQTENQIDNIHFFDGLLYVSTSELNDVGDGNKVVKYGLYSLNFISKEKVIIHQFEEKSLIQGKAAISANSKMWSTDKLYWTFGLKDHVYEIDNSKNFKKIPVTYEFDRSHFDQVLTRYGVFGNKFYTFKSLNMKSTISIKNCGSGEIETFEKYITDDIYSTGKFILKSSLNQNYLVFTKDVLDLSDDLQKEYKMTAADRLLIYAK